MSGHKVFDVRRLRAADVVSFRALLGVFAEAFEERETYLAAQPDDAYLRDLLGGEGLFALAAEAEGSVIGGLVAYELRKFEQARSEVYIYDLAVAEPYRRQGVATALITRLKALAAERAAYVVFVQADYGDDAAIALYTKLGRREDVMHFDIALD